MSSTHQLTQQQVRFIERLPDDHTVVSTRRGVLIVRRPNGQMLRVQPSGHVAATIRVERVQSYLDVHG
jgi:hypothetical protein